ncbi:hypothetical protein CFB82_17720 [Burkholderia sp. HI2714]|nr:hypothetical protein CFB82_17720 [Burkholderia sp. HI2714]
MDSRKSTSQLGRGTQIVNLVDFRRNSPAARTLSEEDARRELKQTILSLSNHVLSCAELVAKCGELFEVLDDVGAHHG